MRADLRFWPRSWRYSPDTRPLVADACIVACTDRYASDVGVEVMRAGGNAIDAAIAVGFALAVVNPEAGNIGGGGFMVIRTADGEVATNDHRETAPRAATRDMFLGRDGNVTEDAVIGPLAAGVPGTVAGLWDIHRRFGTRPWAELVEPAIRLARGFTVTSRYLVSLTPTVLAGVRRFPASAEVFLPGGKAPAAGDTLRQLDLARTLERIRDQGPEGFYTGETADLIVQEMERGGGIINHQDLLDYRSVWREPLAFRYKDHLVYSMRPPSSGGVTLAETAHILESFDVSALPWHSAEHVHLVVEAWKRAYADRNHYLGDPDFVDVPTEALVARDYGRWRAGEVSRERATPSGDVRPALDDFARADRGAGGRAAPSGPSVPGRESENTTHASIVDRDGNAVSFTTTINSWYGNMVVVKGAGFLLNNEMDDFAAKPGTPNQFGLVQGEANAVGPGRRPLSAMAPIIALDPAGELFMVAGTPGGATIITTVFQLLSGVVDHGLDAAQAVIAPRVHHQHLPDRIDYEAGGLEPAVVEALRAKGQNPVERESVSGDAELVIVRKGRRLEGHADPRRGGEAAGY